MAPPRDSGAYADVINLPHSLYFLTVDARLGVSGCDSCFCAWELVVHTSTVKFGSIGLHRVPAWSLKRDDVDHDRRPIPELDSYEDQFVAACGPHADRVRILASCSRP